VTRMLSRRARTRAARIAAPAVATAALVGTLTGCATAVEAEAPDDESYRDGSFQADGPYESPAGGESIIVVVQLENDIVTNVEIGLYPISATSATYQDKFRSGIGDLVIGRDIDTIDVTVVAGSSLTSSGFREALSAIKADALDD